MGRLKSLDSVRGILMFFMALDHAAYFLCANAHPDEFWYKSHLVFTSSLDFLSRFLSHFCAPGFFFLLGVGTSLFVDSRKKAGWSIFELRKYLFVRGCLFIILQFLAENIFWWLAYKSSGPGTLYYVGVLFSLGSSLVILSLFVSFSAQVLGGIAVLGSVAYYLSFSYLSAHLSSYPLFRVLLIPHESMSMDVFFSVFPWAFISLLGVGVGRLISSRPAESFAFLYKLGKMFLIAFSFVWLFKLGNFGLRGYHGVFPLLVKYPPSVSYLLLTLGAIFCILYLLETRPMNIPLSGFFVTLGKSPFFFYLLHLAIFALGGRMLGIQGVSMPIVLILWLAVTVALYFPCQQFYLFKSKQPLESLWRML